MLVGDDDLGRFDRLSVVIAHRHLALGVGTQRLLGPRVASLRNLAQDLVGVIKRRRHEFGRFATRVAEHDALITRALVLVAGRVNALRDVGRLRVEQDFDLGVAPVEAGLLVADVPDRLTRRLHDRLVRQRWPPHFAGDDHTIGGGEGLTGDADLVGINPCLCALAKEKIDDLV